MSKFFQVEKGMFAGQKNSFQNVKFKKNTLDNSSAAETGTILEIIPVHIKNPPVIQFIAYLEKLSDKHDSKYSKEQPFGRPDPYYIWQSNGRKISVSFVVPSSSVESALDNLNNLSWLLASLYPTYKDTLTATSFAASPLFRIRFANLICSSTKGGQGLLGVLEGGVSVTHNHKEGFISINPKNMGSAMANIDGQLLKQAGFDNSFREGQKLLIPKEMKIGLNISVVHDHALGWDASTGEWRGGRSAPGFPYNFPLVRETADTPSAGTAVFDDAQAINNNVPGSADARQAEVVIDDVNTTPGAEVVNVKNNKGK